jgi:hypothetical protein
MANFGRLTGFFGVLSTKIMEKCRIRLPESLDGCMLVRYLCMEEAMGKRGRESELY